MADAAYKMMPLSKSPCWRRLYTDACLLRSLSDIGTLENPDKTIALESIARLDRAIIIAGAAGDGRLDLVIDIIQRIQSEFFRSVRVSESPKVFDSSPLPLPSYTSVELASSSRHILYEDEYPSMLSFQHQFCKKPFILRGYIRDWPAMREHPWSSLDYLRCVAGPGRIVPVEIGKDYRNDDWTQKLMKWDEFIASINFSGVHQQHDEILYLAQHNLLTQFPALRSDIIVPDYAYSCLSAPPDFLGYRPPGNDEQLVINAWLGPKGTISPAHTVNQLRVYVDH
jgi:Cupin-like domain